MPALDTVQRLFVFAELDALFGRCCQRMIGHVRQQVHALQSLPCKQAWRSQWQSWRAATYAAKVHARAAFRSAGACLNAYSIPILRSRSKGGLDVNPCAKRLLVASGLCGRAHLMACVQAPQAAWGQGHAFFRYAVRFLIFARACVAPKQRGAKGEVRQGRIGLGQGRIATGARLGPKAKRGASAI